MLSRAWSWSPGPGPGHLVLVLTSLLKILQPHSPTSILQWSPPQPTLSKSSFRSPSLTQVSMCNPHLPREKKLHRIRFISHFKSPIKPSLRRTSSFLLSPHLVLNTLKTASYSARGYKYRSVSCVVRLVLPRLPRGSAPKSQVWDLLLPLLRSTPWKEEKRLILLNLSISCP